MNDIKLKYIELTINNMISLRNSYYSIIFLFLMLYYLLLVVYWIIYLSLPFQI